MSKTIPKLYDELAEWWQVISPTEDYINEAAFFTQLFKKAGAQSILELGAGGGNIAFYLKSHFDVTLTDIAPKMLEMSKKQNPELKHIVGDMRTLRIDKTFDGVFVHDAVMYMATKEDLRDAITTAYEHCRHGGITVFAPDCTAESIKYDTVYEGHDVGRQSVRYMQWVSDDDPNDDKFNYDVVLAIKDGPDLRTITDRQICGVFPRQTWLDLLESVGFDATAVEDTSTQGEERERMEVFVAIKR